MNRDWAALLWRKAFILTSVPESNSWKVGTTRTPLAWAALVTAVAASET